MEYVIGVDVGGTGTDSVVMDEVGVLTTAKVFSTPPTFVEGVRDVVELTAKKLGLDLRTLLENTKLFLHSTTIAENAIVDKTLANAGLLVTRGCEEILFIARGAYGRWSGLSEEEIKKPTETDKPPAIIPFSLIKGIDERTDIRGKVLAEPDEDEVKRAIDDLVDKGCEGLGVSFLCSFVNPQNENVVKKICQTRYPELLVTFSNELAPVIGEYERTSTVALNVSLMSTVSTYVTNLKATLEEEGFNGKLLIMQAYGGLLSDDEASTRPVGMIESGPAGGLVGSNTLGAILGFDNIVAADLGGTTFKVGVVRKGLVSYEREPIALRYHFMLPKMNITSIGLAGGSLISLDPRTNAPRIGPSSAGARPGPICYGFGGKGITITDMDLILGYLNSDFFFEGRASLDYEAALEAFKLQVADPLGLDVMEAAGAMYKLANSMIYDLLHKVTVERGVDPRDYVLFSFGGTAGMHLGAVAQQLQMKGVVIPFSAAVMGAYGLVSADMVHEYQLVQPMLLPVNVDVINGIFQQLVDRLKEQLKSEGFDEGSISIERLIDTRYRHQIHEISVPIEFQGNLSEHDIEEVCATFDRMYEDRYGKGSGHKEGGREMVTFRVRGFGTIRKPELATYELSPPDPKAAFSESREIYIPSLEHVADAQCYDFEKLLAGNEIEGPALIWSPITTILVDLGQKGVLDCYKNILLTW